MKTEDSIFKMEKVQRHLKQTRPGVWLSKLTLIVVYNKRRCETVEWKTSFTGSMVSKTTDKNWLKEDFQILA